MLRVSFVMEQHLGHQTYYQNIRRAVEQAADVCPTWVPVTYCQPGGLPERLPLLSPGLRGMLRGLCEVRAGLRAPAEAVFFNTQVPAALAGSALRRRPYVVATDLTPIQYDALGALYRHRPDRNPLLRALKHRLNRALFRGAARLLPWSSWARDSLVRDYDVDPDLIEVLPPGVDLGRWQPGPKQPDGPVRALFVGGDFARKGGALLLDALRSLPPGVLELHLVTRTPLAPAPGVVVHHGLTPNSPALVELYRSSDLFVLPTAAEAFGIAAVEACAAGLPVVASAVGGLTDIVADGETGFLIPPGDTAALAARLTLLAGDPALRQRQGRAARARAEARFDARRNADRVLACLAAAAREPTLKGWELEAKG
ncbi:MAG TPA: glycosyltransferase family 4 protein [Roseiflexaceae bacterium]|nr:glycosyltransferase family 4 protein [Roseiflexaceae bacterium]